MSACRKADDIYINGFFSTAIYEWELFPKVAKRYLNNLVEQYLVFAEGQAMRRIKMYMKDWIEKLNGFLSLNDRAILEDAGRISHDMAKQLAESEYDKFNKKRIEWTDKQDSDFDKTVKMIEAKQKKFAKERWR